MNVFFLWNILLNYCLQINLTGTGVLKVRHLTLNLTLRSTCRLIFTDFTNFAFPFIHKLTFTTSMKNSINLFSKQVSL